MNMITLNFTRRTMLTVWSLVFYFVILINAQIEINFDDSPSDVFEGDIKELSMESFQSYINGNPNGNYLNESFLNRFRRWSGNTVPYVFDRFTFPNPTMRGRVQDAMREFESKTCIKFVHRSSEDDYIEIISGDGCYSFPGRIGGRQALSLGDKCLNHDTILHELMHALGFLHEQSRPDRDEYITVHYNNIPTRWHKNFQKYNQSQINPQNTPYDFKSVMHYSTMIDGIQVISPIERGRKIKSNGLSEMDVQEINAVYNCPTVSTYVTPPPASKQCRQGSFYCGNELKLLNYKNVFSNSSLYRCDADGEAHFHFECGADNCFETASSFCGCKRGTQYCGHELVRLNNVFPGIANQSLYTCQSLDQVDFIDTCDKFCSMNPNGHSSCRSALPAPCMANTRYCGFQLTNIGHRNADANTLYLCMQDGSGSFVRKCLSGCLLGERHAYCASGRNARPFRMDRKRLR